MINRMGAMHKNTQIYDDNAARVMALPEPTLRRLPWYLAYLTTLHAHNDEYVSTTPIARALEVAPAQIAKDLSFLGLKGKTRIGYNVSALEDTLRSFLGFERRHNAAISGVGSLGAALVSDSGLQRYGLNIVAGFDISPALTGKEINGVKVLTPDRMADTVRDLDISIGILAVPVESAAEVAENFIAAGVKAIWNFTPARIREAEGVVVTDTSIYSHLAVMYNRLANLGTKA